MSSHTCLHYFALCLGETHRKGSQCSLHPGAWIQEDLGREDDSVKWRITQHRSQPPGGKITGVKGLPYQRLLKGTSLDKPGLASIHASGDQGSRVSHQALLSWGRGQGGQQVCSARSRQFLELGCLVWILHELTCFPLWLGENQFSVPTHSRRQISQLSPPPPPLGDFILFFFFLILSSLCILKRGTKASSPAPAPRRGDRCAEERQAGPRDNRLLCLWGFMSCTEPLLNHDLF